MCKRPRISTRRQSHTHFPGRFRVLQNGFEFPFSQFIFGYFKNGQRGDEYRSHALHRLQRLLAREEPMLHARNSCLRGHDHCFWRAGMCGDWCIRALGRNDNSIHLRLGEEGVVRIPSSV